MEPCALRPSGAVHALQAELAEKLESLGHLRAATPATLADVIGGMRQGELVPYQKGDPGGIAAAIGAFMGQK